MSRACSAATVAAMLTVALAVKLAASQAHAPRDITADPAALPAPAVTATQPAPSEPGSAIAMAGNDHPLPPAP